MHLNDINFMCPVRCKPTRLDAGHIRRDRSEAPDRDSKHEESIFL